MTRILTILSILAVSVSGVAFAEGQAAAPSHSEHAKHSHQHKKGCGHKAEKHGDHEDYEHDGHHHKSHAGHIDECAGPEAEAAKPAAAQSH